MKMPQLLEKKLIKITILSNKNNKNQAKKSKNLNNSSKSNQQLIQLYKRSVKMLTQLNKLLCYR